MHVNDWLAWYAAPCAVCPVLPWWLRIDPHLPADGRAALMRGWFAEAYPGLSPYYPFPSPSAAWLDPWALQPYGGYWWM
ncbi:MAG: hypothetical protein IRZ33_08130 [Alicyclobacillaceae bacterium]|nr:hypothetical protein [Alicyclobacillaceae bacterium]